MKQILVIAVLMLSLASCTKQASNQLATEQSKKAKGHPQIESVLATMTLTHNGDGTFVIDYSGETSIAYVFLRSGDSLYSNGNVYPSNSQSWYNNPPIGSFSTWVSGTYYQAVVIVGDFTPDANGVIGSNWLEIFTNKVQ